MTVASNQLTEWLSRLVQIPSVSTNLAGPRAGKPGEGELAAQVARWFQEFGGEVHSEEVLPDRPNIYGIWRGRSERWAAVDVHIDTVGVEQMTGDPFSGEVKDERVHGRGAVDTKASLAVVLALLEAMHQNGQTPEPNLLIVTTVDEELQTSGALAFAKWIRRQGIPLDQLAVAEPTLCGPVYGHKGVSRLEFEVHGKSAHTSQPHMGQNAITAAAQIVTAFDAEHHRLQALPPGTDLGNPTLTVSLISGGTGINTVPDSCRVSIDWRIVSGEDPDEVATRLYNLAQESSPLPVTMKKLLEIGSFLQPSDTPWVRHLADWSGREPAIVPYGTNAWAYDGLAQECVVIGPGSIDQAHGAEEWVTIAELDKLARIYSQWWGI